MRQYEYMNELARQLAPLSYPARQEILDDFKEHFSVGLEEGKTEEEICADLGSPVENAKQYLENGGNNGNNQNGPPPYYAPPYQNTYAAAAPAYAPVSVPAAQSVQSDGGKGAFIFLFVVLLVVSILGFFPAGGGLVIAFFATIIAAVAAGIFMESVFLGLCLVSAGLVCLSTGMLLILLPAWGLQACYKRMR